MKTKTYILFILFLFTLNIYSIKMGKINMELSYNGEGYKNSTTADTLSATLNKGTFYLQEIGENFSLKFLGFNLQLQSAIRFTNDSMYDNKFELSNYLIKLEKSIFSFEAGKIFVDTAKNGFNYSLTGIKGHIRFKRNYLEIFGGNLWQGRDYYQYSRWGLGSKVFFPIKNSFKILIFTDFFSDYGIFSNISDDIPKIKSGINGGLQFRFSKNRFLASFESAGTKAVGEKNNYNGFSIFLKTGLRLKAIDILFDNSYQSKNYISPSHSNISNHSFSNFNIRYFQKKFNGNFSIHFKKYYDKYRQTYYYSTNIGLSYQKNNGNKMRIINYIVIKHTSDQSYSMYGDQVAFSLEIPFKKFITLEPSTDISFEKEKISGLSDNIATSSVLYSRFNIITKKNFQFYIRFGFNLHYSYYFHTKIHSFNLLPVGIINFNIGKFYTNLNSNYISAILNTTNSNVININGNIGYYFDKRKTKSLNLILLYINENYTDNKVKNRIEYQIKLAMSLYL